MYRILIADDEKGYCDLLEKSINRMEGFHVVGKAYDGERAAELAGQLHPDILITDINMPKLSGLELLRRVQEADQKIETLVISGYSDFSYAKSAITLGVNDYLVKPFLPDELHSILIKMSGQIEKRKALEEHVKLLQQEADLRREEAAKGLLLRLMTGEGKLQDTGALIREGKKYGVDLTQTMYCVCVARVRPYIDRLIPLVCGGSYFSEGTTVYAAVPNEKLILFLISSSADSELTFYKDVENGFHHIAQSLEKYYSTRFWCSVGNIYHSVSDIRRSYREAIAVWKGMLDEDENIVHYNVATENAPSGKFSRPIELENRLLRLILAAEADRAVEILRQIIDYYGEFCIYNPEFVSVSLIRLVFSISEVVSKTNNGEVAENMMVLDYLKNYFTQSSLRDASIVLERYVRDACEPFHSFNGEHSDRLVRTLKELIEKNLSDENFGLESASRQMYFSSNYIRQLFKQKVGESFMEYLIRRRMETARSLLTDSSMQIQKIAEATGYSNSRYFASCFKKYYGCTPTECRSGIPAVHPPKEND